MLSEEDKNLMLYYLNYKSIEDWAGFESKKHLIQVEFPDLLVAIEQVRSANRLLNFEIGKVVEAIQE